MGWQIKDTGHLPRGGGLWDQPAGMVSKALRLFRIWQACARWTNALETLGGKELQAWQEQNGETLQIVERWERLRAEVAARHERR